MDVKHHVYLPTVQLRYCNNFICPITWHSNPVLFVCSGVILQQDYMSNHVTKQRVLSVCLSGPDTATNVYVQSHGTASTSFVCLSRSNAATSSSVQSRDTTTSFVYPDLMQQRVCMSNHVTLRQRVSYVQSRDTTATSFVCLSRCDTTTCLYVRTWQSSMLVCPSVTAKSKVFPCPRTTNQAKAIMIIFIKCFVCVRF